MANSLLAHLFTHIRGSQEDVATLALQYLLESSKGLNITFSEYIAHQLNIEEIDEIKYQCQVTGSNLERPDIAGNIDGQEVILIEAKFYAALTENQPIGYIERLKSNNGKGLLFIVPKSRKRLVWKEIMDRCLDMNVSYLADFCNKVDNISVGIISWDEMLNFLELEVTSKFPELSHDLHQLVGFYKEVEQNAFVPYKSEDLDQATAKKIGSYYDVIEETFKLIRSDRKLETKTKGRSYYSCYRKGYWAGIYIKDIWVGINFTIDAWQRTDTIDTPFWLTFSANEEVLQNKIDLLISQLPKEYVCKPFKNSSLFYFALPTKVHSTIEELAFDFKNKIIRYIDMIYKG